MPRTLASCRPNNPRGFTLLELLVVLLLVSLVAGVVVPSAVRSIRQAAWRDVQRRLVTEVSALPQRAYTRGEPMTVEAASLIDVVPDWPEGWQLSASGPLRYAANGMAEGGWLMLRRADGTQARWRIEPLTGEPVLQP